jgi:hypothetical protein
MEEEATAVEETTGGGSKGLRLIIGLGLVLAVALVTAGLVIGLKLGGTSGGAATAAGASGAPALSDAQRVAKASEFVACVRQNGVPNFPDPGTDGSIRVSPKDGIDPTTPEFQAAEQKCDSLRPPERSQPGAKSMQGKIDTKGYVACMRGNGVPDFPEPDAEGTFGKIDAPKDTLLKAHEACKKHLPEGAPPPPV